MDLLGSILNSMDKPPGANEKHKELVKKQEKVKKREKEELNRYRKFVEERIGRFVKNEERKSIQFEPIEKIYRTVVHDVAEIAGLLGSSFGQEGVDRYIIIYKKEHAPSEDEINARKNGCNVWNEDKAKEYAQKRVDDKLIEEEKSKAGIEIVPTSNYKTKYKHLIGEDAALEAAKKTESNKSYGFVPSENKKDVRSIEQTMADIQAKKKLKTSHTSE